MRKPKRFRPPPRTFSDLSPHDRQFVLLVVDGLSHAEIAKKLGLQPSTVMCRASDLGRLLLSTPGCSPVRRILRWALTQPEPLTL